MKAKEFYHEISGMIPPPDPREIKVSREVSKLDSNSGNLTLIISSPELYVNDGRQLSLIPEVETDEIRLKIYRGRDFNFLVEISTKYIPPTVLQYTDIDKLKDSEKHPKHEIAVTWKKNECALIIDQQIVDIRKIRNK